MHFSFSTLLAVALLGFGANAAPQSSFSHLTKRANCTNTPTSRNCWGEYDLSTDYYNVVPNTGVTREYWLDIVNTTAAPDGFPRQMLLINGTYPGPTLIGDWGDTFVVHVTNSMADNGTSIHFHGIRQNYTTQYDGIVGITQCPLAPRQTQTYTWRAVQYGTTWYHSHFSLQAWEGVLGGLIINGPASANYDVDLGSLFLSDWSHQTVDELFDVAQTTGPPAMDNGLINGTNTWNNSGVVVGSRFQTVFTPGTSYRLRLVNSAIDTHFKFSIDNHTLTVIGMDLVPIQPYTTDVLSIGIAQRYDVIVTANQAVDNYWIRAVPQVACSNNANSDDIKGIVRYIGSLPVDPTTTAHTQTDDCDGEPYANLVPYLAANVGSANSNSEVDITLAIVTGAFRWFLDGNTMLVNWSQPSILDVIQGNTDYFNHSEVIELNGTSDQWAYFVIQSAIGVTHPIHTHGHDFFVLASGAGTFNATTTALNVTNPARRDVTMLPASGFLVLGILIDNPGVWAVHCHIGWHQSEGLALQLVERKSEIAATVNQADMNAVCDAWNQYWLQGTPAYKQTDSGI